MILVLMKDQDRFNPQQKTERESHNYAEEREARTWSFGGDSTNSHIRFNLAQSHRYMSKFLYPIYSFIYIIYRDATNNHNHKILFSFYF